MIMYSKYSVFRIYVGSAGVLQILETVCRLLSSAVKITVIVKSLTGQVCSDFYHIILNMSSASLKVPVGAALFCYHDQDALLWVHTPAPHDRPQVCTGWTRGKSEEDLEIYEGNSKCVCRRQI